MEDGNISNANKDSPGSSLVTNPHCEQIAKLAANGHEFVGESSSATANLWHAPEPMPNAADESFKKRINPLKIHLGKRPFIDNPLRHTSNKKKKQCNFNPSETNLLPLNIAPRMPKLIPKKKTDPNQLHNIASQQTPQDRNVEDSERNKPVPRLVHKSQLLQFKKHTPQKGTNLKNHTQNVGQQPNVKFKCRKCCSLSFKTLAQLKEHIQVCKAPSKAPASSPESVPSTEANAGGPSRVTRKVYLCSACGTYYENWNLFLHMREVHNRHICLFCLGMFSKAEKLSAHMTNKHNVQEFNYDSKEDFFKVYNGTLYLMCCECDEICSEQDDFFNHDCNNIKPKPVPVLVSKNAAKINCNQNKTNTEISTNGPSNTKETKVAHEDIKVDKKDNNELESDLMKPSHHIPRASDCGATNILQTFKRELVSSHTRDSFQNNDESVKHTDDNVQNTSSESEINSSDSKIASSPIHTTAIGENTDLLPNGDDSIEHSDSSCDSPVPMDIYSPDGEDREHSPLPCPPTDKEKECGIKLKLSLNNANSPVIINSTVDPSVGLQYSQKTPLKARKPPKKLENIIKKEPIPPKTPSIKMTICDKANSPFIKTTIYENDPETTVKSLLNNNFETSTKQPEHKSENTIKSTIYDNKIEDLNTMNRVPKLTVRVPKELLDKDSSNSDYSSDSDCSDKLTVDENNLTTIEREKPEPEQKEQLENITSEEQPQALHLAPQVESEVKEIEEQIDNNITHPQDVISQPTPQEVPVVDGNVECTDQQIDVEKVTGEDPIEEMNVVELSFDKPLDKYPIKDLLKLFLPSTLHNCIYCNHVRKIAVNGEQLCLHMAAEHRFSATVDSITAEELMPETIATKVNTDAEELRKVFMNMDSYDSVDKNENVLYDHTFECFQCYFKTSIHKDLYLHNRKMHQKTILLCVMCKTNFYSYSELLCHLCPGTYDSEFEIKFRCCLCSVDTIPSSFRLMVHLRKIHNACDVCLEFCHNQSRLSNHVWKHKLHHLCYRCGIAYRNKPDITKHLFWKHGTESVLCKKCLQKKWPHVYHFCTPPAVFICDECNLQFTRAVYLKVHKRFHTNEYPHSCTEEGCTEKFVSKKLLMKHLEEHQRKLATVDLDDKTEKKPDIDKFSAEAGMDSIPVIDLVDENTNKEGTTGASDTKTETDPMSKKSKKKKLKDKDALLLDVNLPELNLSESDSSDESDCGLPTSEKDEKEKVDEKPIDEKPFATTSVDVDDNVINISDIKKEEKIEPIEDEKPNEKQVLDIWDNFKKYQAKTDKPKEKTPPLVPIRKHVCESDHDYCLIPADLNGDDDPFSADKKKNKKKERLQNGMSSSSSSSSSDSDSSCSCGSNCSCSSSSGSSSSTSSDSDSSDEPNRIIKKKKQRSKVANRRMSNGSNVDVMGNAETPVLVPEKAEPTIAETDLETNESDTDEEFYDEHPQLLANKIHAEKRNQLLLLATVAPSDCGGSISGEPSRPVTPIKEIPEKKEKSSSSKKKSKKKKRSKSSRKHGPIKLNIPKEMISQSEIDVPPPLAPSPLVPNKITISLQSNTVQIPEVSTQAASNNSTPLSSADSKRASKRRRVPNRFYGYSSEEEGTPPVALKPYQPPKLEWRKEDLPSPITHKTPVTHRTPLTHKTLVAHKTPVAHKTLVPHKTPVLHRTPVTHRAKKEVPSLTISHRMPNYIEPLRLKAPIPDPEPPKILMNTESMESSDSDSSVEGALEIYQPNLVQNPVPVPPPTYLNSGTSSLPYAFQRPAGVRQAREGESVYCYCRCPYDEVSEMIACDADGCSIEWFHFECVGIMVPPKGKWYCPECRKKQSFPGYR